MNNKNFYNFRIIFMFCTNQLEVYMFKMNPIEKLEVMPVAGLSCDCFWSSQMTFISGHLDILMA